MNIFGFIFRWIIKQPSIEDLEFITSIKMFKKKLEDKREQYKAFKEYMHEVYYEIQKSLLREHTKTCVPCSWVENHPKIKTVLEKRGFTVTKLPRTQIEQKILKCIRWQFDHHETYYVITWDKKQFKYFLKRL